MDSNRSHRIWLAFVAIILLIAGLVFLASGHRTSLKLNAVSAVPATFSVTAAYGHDSLVFSNGRSFVRYNYANGQVSILSPDAFGDNLANIDKLYASADLNYLVFHMTSAAAGTPLHDQLQNAGLDPSQPDWLTYDVASQSFQPLAQDVLAVHLLNNTLYTLSDGSSGQQFITSYSLSGLRQQKTFSVPNCNDFYPLSNGVLLSTSDSRVLETTDGVINNQLFTSASILNVAPDGRYALGTLHNKNGTSLVVFDLHKKSVKNVAGNIGSHMAWTTSNSVIINVGDQTALSIYSASSGKLSGLSFSDPRLAKGGKAVNMLDDQTVIVSDSAGGLYLAGRQVADLKKIDAAYDRTLQGFSHPIDLAYYPDQGTFIVTLDAASAVPERDAVYGQLKQDGYNPLLVDIQMVLFSPPPRSP